MFGARSLAIGLLAAAAAVSVAPSVHAQKKPHTKTDPRLAEAKRLFEEGADAYRQGSYEQAIALWQKSHEISQKPLIYESIANAYERLGNARKAREFLGKWREAAPKDELPLLETRIKNLEARVAREDEQEAQRKKAADDKARREQEERDKALREAAAKKAAISLPGIILASVGGAAVIAGVSLDIVAAGKRPDAAAVCKGSGGQQLCLSSARDGIQQSTTLALAGDILWIAGAAAAAGGVALILAKKLSQPKETPPPSALVIAPAGAGLVAFGRF